VKCDLFSDSRYEQVQAGLHAMLSAHLAGLRPFLLQSPRAAGDRIQDLLADKSPAVLGDWCTNYEACFARRAMADLAFEDSVGCYYRVDVKTHRKDSSFNMPNLVSVERLSRFYEDDRNYFVILLVSYEIVGGEPRIDEPLLMPIEHLSWDSLTIGALGWGQLQIKNVNELRSDRSQSRRAWMLRLCQALLDFYPLEIAKIHDRVAYFERVYQQWLAKPEQE